MVIAGTRQESTNIYVLRSLCIYKWGPRFSVSLIDSAGREIPKTAKGRSYRRPMDPVTVDRWTSSREPLDQLGFWGQSPRDIGSFDVDKCFRRKGAGWYTVEVSVAVMANTAGDQYVPLVLPTAKLTLDLPASEAGASWPSVVIYAFGILCCAVGSLWLWRDFSRQAKGGR